MPPTPKATPQDWHEMRFNAVEDRMSDAEAAIVEHAKALNDGRVQFAQIVERLSALTAQVAELITTVKWGVRLIIAAVVGAVLKLALVGT